MKENERAVKLLTDQLIPTALFHQFNAAMKAFGPFEPEPNLAVAVSGGSDSIALVLLADFWVRARGGRVTALSINHGLRPYAAVEIRIVNDWMQQRRIRHQTLYWPGKKPKTRLQSRARDARYQLINEWCRDHHFLHVLIGHTADDQAETYLMRLRRQSHLDGLAGMSAIRELTNCRLLRPLLAIKREDLRKFLNQADQKWLDDPTNKDRRYGRTKVRNLISSGLFVRDSLLHSASSCGRQRVVAEREADRFIAFASRLNPAGYIVINRPNLRDLESGAAMRVLGRAIASVGGNWHFPSQIGLRNVLSTCVSSTLTSRTLGGCRIIASSADITICREARNLPDAMKLVSGVSFLWDGRIFVTVGRIPEGAWQIGVAVNQTWSEKEQNVSEYKRWRELPKAIRASLPVLIGSKGVFSAPLLAYNHREAGIGGVCEARNSGVKMTLRLSRPLSAAGFCVAK